MLDVGKTALVGVQCWQNCTGGRSCFVNKWTTGYPNFVNGTRATCTHVVKTIARTTYYFAFVNIKLCSVEKHVAALVFAMFEL